MPSKCNIYVLSLKNVAIGRLCLYIPAVFSGLFTGGKPRGASSLYKEHVC